MKILVTGSHGFIGEPVRERFQSHGHDVYGLDISDGNDVRDADRVMKLATGMDAVIHLAGVLGTHELFDSVHEAIDSNIHGTVNVLDACVKNDAMYIGVTMPQVFPSIYTATKVAATRMASAYAIAHGLRVAHVQAYNAFGPRQAHGPGHPQKIIPTFATEAWNDRPLPIWGTGNQSVDLIHTSDLAECFYQAFNGLVVGNMFWPTNDFVVQGGTGNRVSVLEVAHLVSEFTGRPLVARYLPMRRGETETQIVADDPAVKVPWDKIVDQLEETVAWYKP